MPKIADGPSYEELRRLFFYDPETGVFVRRCNVGKRGKKGARGDGSINGRGYRQLKMGGKAYLAHRCAILYMTGQWPALPVDHINGVQTDNRYVNLRVASHRTNNENRRSCWANKKSSRYLGVYPSNGRWAAHIKHNYRALYIGTFDTEEEAHAAYLERKRQLHAGCTL